MINGELVLPYNEHIDIPVSALKANWLLVGGPGHGKTWTMLNALTRIIAAGGGMTIFDNAGQLYGELLSWVAAYADRLLDAYRDVDPEIRERVLKRSVWDRFTFAFQGDAHPQLHGIDLLARRVGANGERERISRVVSGARKTFDIIDYQSIMERKTFNETSELVWAALIAGNRPITEADALMNDPAYWYRLLHWIGDAKTLEHPEDRAYVVPRLADLRQYLDLRFRKVGDGYAELPPYGRPFTEQFGSTIRALRPFAPESPFSRYFDHDTFNVERLVFGDGVLVVATDEASATIRQTFFSSVYGFIERMLRKRTPKATEYRRPEERDEDAPDYPRHYLVCDDFATWARPPITDYMSTSRNNNVSWIVSYQDENQFADVDLREFPQTLEGLCALQTHYRPESDTKAERLARKLARSSPMAMMLPYETATTMHSASASKQHGRSATDGVTTTEGKTDAESRFSSTSFSSSASYGTALVPHVFYEDGMPLIGPELLTVNDGSGSGDAESSGEGVSAAHSTSSAKSQQVGTNESEGETTTEGRSTVGQYQIVCLSDQTRLVADDILHMGRFDTVTFYNDRSGNRHSSKGRMLPYDPVSAFRRNRPILRHLVEAMPHFVRPADRTRYVAALPAFLPKPPSRSERRKEKKEKTDFTKAPVDQKGDA